MAGSIQLDSSDLRVADLGTSTAEGEKIEYETRETSKKGDAGLVHGTGDVFNVSSTPVSPPNGPYGSYNSATDNLANKKRQFIEILHVPTQLNVFFKSFVNTFQDSYNTEYNVSTS